MGLPLLLRIGNAPTAGGTRGFLAFWMGGGADGPAVTPPPVLDYGPGGIYPEFHRHSKKLRKEIKRAEQFLEEAPKVITKAVERVRNAPEMAISESLVANMADALAQARQIANGIAGDLAALQRKQMADRETKRAIRAAKALLDEIEALERDDEEAITLLLAN